MPVDTSILAPPMQEEPQRGGMGPGVIEGLKSAIAWLQKQGLEIEDIIQAIMKLAGTMGLDISEEQMMALIEQTGGQGAAPMGQQPEMGVPMGSQLGMGAPMEE